MPDPAFIATRAFKVVLKPDIPKLQRCDRILFAFGVLGAGFTALI